MTWQEPYFFAYRNLGWRDWLLRLGAWLAWAVALAALFVAIGRADRPPRFVGTRGAVVLTACGLVALALGELPNARRTVTITREAIEVRPSWRLALLGQAPGLVAWGTERWNRAAIRRVELHCARGDRAPDGVMIVYLKHSRPQRVGLCGGVPARAVADLLAGHGLAVALDGWAPDPGNPPAGPA
ncbi:MAG TPA: hypothetical protein VF590_13940 [Isosphaeraceae bacterium]